MSRTKRGRSEISVAPSIGDKHGLAMNSNHHWNNSLRPRKIHKPESMHEKLIHEKLIQEKLR